MEAKDDSFSTSFLFLTHSLKFLCSLALLGYRIFTLTLPDTSFYFEAVRKVSTQPGKSQPANARSQLVNTKVSRFVSITISVSTVSRWSVSSYPCQQLVSLARYEVLYKQRPICLILLVCQPVTYWCESVTYVGVCHESVCMSGSVPPT